MVHISKLRPLVRESVHKTTIKSKSLTFVAHKIVEKRIQILGLIYNACVCTKQGLKIVCANFLSKVLIYQKQTCRKTAWPLMQTLTHPYKYTFWREGKWWLRLNWSQIPLSETPVWYMLVQMGPVTKNILKKPKHISLPSNSSSQW